MKHRDSITRVIFLGVTDDESWPNSFPILAEPITRCYSTGSQSLHMNPLFGWPQSGTNPKTKTSPSSASCHSLTRSDQSPIPCAAASTRRDLAADNYAACRMQYAGRV